MKDLSNLEYYKLEIIFFIFVNMWILGSKFSLKKKKKKKF